MQARRCWQGNTDEDSPGRSVARFAHRGEVRDGCAAKAVGGAGVSDRPPIKQVE